MSLPQVQAVTLEDGSEGGTAELWKATPPSKLMESRIKCQWSFAPSSGAPVAAVAAVTASLASTTAAVISPAIASPEIAPVVAKSVNVEAVAPVPVRSVDPVAPVAGLLAVGCHEARLLILLSPAVVAKPVVKSTVAAPAASAAVAVKPKPQDMPSIVLILLVFILGYLFGKFVM